MKEKIKKSEKKLFQKLYPEKKISSIFGLIVIHPHSGRVNRSVVERILRHKASGYDGHTTEDNVAYLKEYANEYLELKDANNRITGVLRPMPRYDINGNLH